MKTWKKAGLTALAGSLVATSAFAGAMTVSGTANIAYAGNTGTEDSSSATTPMVAGQDGSRWGMTKSISFAGSGEMDNGWTVSLGTTFANAGDSAVNVKLDMGDAGSLDFEGGTSSRGIGKIADMMPTANEDVGDGIDVDGTTGSGGLSGAVSGGVEGFHYGKAMDMVEIGIGYAPKGGATATAGNASGSAGASKISGFIKIDPMDGLEIGFGTGEVATAAGSSNTDDHTTMYVTYVYGPVTFGYQASEIDKYSSASDDEATRWGVLYAVNDEFSISYQNHENDQTNIATDEEASGWSASYTVGSMTFKAHRNHATNVGNTIAMESEHTEVGVTFAF